MAAQPPDIDALLDRHRDRFRRLLEEIVAEEAGEDPFSVPLDRFLSASDGERAVLVRRAATMARERVEHELEARGAAWLVLVGGDVMLASADALAIPSPEEVLRLGEPRGLVAYLFEAPLIEESPRGLAPWAVLTGRDRYSTVPLTVGETGQETAVVADLDTGSHATLLDGRLGLGPAPTWFAGRHLGDSFLWSPASLEIAMVTKAGKTLSCKVPVRFVRDWEQSPFVRINPARRALVGRDLLRAFGLSVVLRSVEAETEILGLRD